MKNRGEDLKKAYEQLSKYMIHLLNDVMSNLWLVCDFENFELYHRIPHERLSVGIKDFHKHIRLFDNIVKCPVEPVGGDETKINVWAANKRQNWVINLVLMVMKGMNWIFIWCAFYFVCLPKTWVFSRSTA
jgi:hypothetical protein